MKEIIAKTKLGNEWGIQIEKNDSLLVKELNPSSKKESSPISVSSLFSYQQLGEGHFYLQDQTDTSKGEYWISHQGQDNYLISWPGGQVLVNIASKEENQKGGSQELSLRSLMAGKISSIEVKEGEVVKVGQCILCVEAMKMENQILAQKMQKIKKIFVREGKSIDAGEILVEFEEVETT